MNATTDSYSVVFAGLIKHIDGLDSAVCLYAFKAYKAGDSVYSKRLL